LPFCSLQMRWPLLSGYVIHCSAQFTDCHAGAACGNRCPHGRAGNNRGDFEISRWERGCCDVTEVCVYRGRVEGGGMTITRQQGNFSHTGR
jgi:hypothetical protein